MKTKSLSILALTLAVSAVAHADSLMLGGWSRHVIAGDYNSNHHVYSLEYHGYAAGTFLNSYSDRTYYAGYDWKAYDNSYFSIHAIAGGVYGYDKDKIRGVPMIGKVIPAIVPYIELNTPYIQPTLALFGPAVAITFKVEF